MPPIPDQALFSANLLTWCSVVEQVISRVPSMLYVMSKPSTQSPSLPTHPAWPYLCLASPLVYEASGTCGRCHQTPSKSLRPCPLPCALVDFICQCLRALSRATQAALPHVWDTTGVLGINTPKAALSQ